MNISSPDSRNFWWLRPVALALALMLSFFSFRMSAQAEDAAPAPQTLNLWNGHAPVGDGAFQAGDAEITLYPASHPNGAAMVICPGGGYARLVTGPEGQGIAQWLNGHGIAGIVLQYRLPAERRMVPLLDAQRALRVVRFHSKEWGLDAKRLGIIGFSAGGHVASTADTHFDAGDPQATDPVERMSCRPDFAILVYPVITMGEKGHAGSRKNLLGADPTPEMIEQFSNEKHVTPQTPPTFLAHAVDDKAVPVENSRMFFEALQANNVASKLLELPEGGHGLNGYKGPMWDAWQTQSIDWLREQKIIPQDAP